MTTIAEPIEFQGYPKTPRLFRNVVITEKIDGTNAAVGITPDGRIYAQSRNRLITPEPGNDNAGFAAWVAENAGTLTDDLGPGLHFGEWWGQGIQRGYGLTEKRFSLFNVARWGKPAPYFYTPRLGVVPDLGGYTLDTTHITSLLEHLAEQGSYAAPGFMNPEGVCVYHTASRQTYKALLDADHLPKSLITE